MKSYKFWFSFTSIAILMGLSYVFVFPKKQVIAQAATRGQAIEAISGTVQVIAELEAPIVSNTFGSVQEIYIKMNQSVEKNTPLIQLSKEAIEVSIDIIKTDIEFLNQKKELHIPLGNLELHLDYLEHELNSLQIKASHNGASAFEITRKIKEVEAAQNNILFEKISQEMTLKQRELQLKEREIELKKTTISASMNGIVSEITIYPGQIVYQGTILGKIISSKRSILMEVSDEDFPGVAPGQKASVQLAGYRYLAIPATVSYVYPTIAPNSKLRTVMLDPDESFQHILVPGISGEASLIKGYHNNALIIPRRALLGKYVYVVQDGKIRIREVQTGFLSLQKAEILSGIQEGDLVVLENQTELSDGQSVRVKIIESKK